MTKNKRPRRGYWRWTPEAKSEINIHGESCDYTLMAQMFKVVNRSQRLDDILTTHKNITKLSLGRKRKTVYTVYEVACCLSTTQVKWCQVKYTEGKLSLTTDTR